MKNIYLTLFILTVSVLNVNCQTQDIETKNKKVFKIQLAEKEKLQFKNFKGTNYLQGTLEIKFQNISDTAIKLLDMGEHSIVFVSTDDSSKTYVPVHQCRAVEFFRSKHYSYINLAPGKIKKTSHNTWACDGSSFDMPPPGKYKVYVRTLEEKTFYKKRLYLLKNFHSGMNIKEIIDKAREVLHSEIFWEGAVYSNAVLIEL